MKTVLKLQPCPKSNHARRAVAAQANAKQARWRNRVRQRAETGLRGWLARNAGIAQYRKPEVSVIEDIEELAGYSQLHTVAQSEPFGQV